MAGISDTQSKRPLPSNSDVVVIGAGLGGLVCALELAQQGFKVCVLEQHEKPGGYAHSFCRGKYTFDVSLHHIGGLEPGCMNYAILGGIGILDKLEIRRRKTLLTAEFPGFTISLPNDLEQMLEELGQRFPRERSRLYAMFTHLRQLKYETIAEWLDPEYDLPIEKRLSTLYRNNTLADLFGRFISDPELLAVLGQLWMYIGLPPGISTANFSSCVFGGAFMEGTRHLVGGGSSLVRAMVERLDELGGECLTNMRVAGIRVEDNRAVGVELENGEFVSARLVVSNANPYQTFFELIPGDEISRIFRYRLEQMQSSMSMYSTYLGLDCPPSAIGVDFENFFFNHDLDLDQAYRRALANEVRRTNWCLTNYENLDDTFFPEGRGIVSIAELTPSGEWLELDAETYAGRKEEVLQTLLAKYDARFPGLRKHAVVTEFGTPRTMARYSRNHQGAVYGLAQTVEQSNSKRLRNRAPVMGLYLTGAWTWAGGGYEGAMMTGVQTAASILLESNAPRPVARKRLIHRPEEFAPLRLDDSDEAKTGLATHPYVVAVTAYGDELDIFGAGRPSECLRYLDRGRVESIDAVCTAAEKESWLSRYVLNVYRIDIRKLEPARAGERLTVLTGLRKTSSHRSAFDQKIVRPETGEEIADAVVEVLFLDLDKQLVPIPDEFPGGVSKGPAKLPPLKPIPFSNESHFTHRTRFRVYYEDTDAQGIAYHVTQLRFCERALFELLRPALPAQPGAEATAAAFRISRIDIRYLKAALLGDRLEVRTGVRKEPGRSFLIDQRVVSRASADVVSDTIIKLEFGDGTEQTSAVYKLLSAACSKEA